jgi:hypothetical protein
MEESLPLCEGPSEVPHYIAVIPAAIFLLPFSAQKSHVKPQNHSTQTK